MGGIISSSPKPKELAVVPTVATNGNSSMANIKKIAANPKSSQAVRDSWQAVKKLGAEKLGTKLFMKLFEVDPDTFQMFKTFREEEDWQKSKAFTFHSKSFVNVIGSAVNNHQGESEVTRTMHTLGAAHSFFAIRQEHFDTLRAELLIQLRAVLDKQFSQEVEQAWMKGYDLVAKCMLHAMQHSSTRQLPHAEAVASTDPVAHAHPETPADPAVKRAGSGEVSASQKGNLRRPSTMSLKALENFTGEMMITPDAL
ncbi:globin [archaeon]|nr:MAG: globin [archaeon]